MKQYALVVKQDEMSANIAEKIKKGLTGIMEYNLDDPDLVLVLVVMEQCFCQCINIWSKKLVL